MELITLVGLTASILVTVAYIPEVVKTIRTKETRDLALSWIVTLDLGQVLYLIYSLAIMNIPVIITSSSGVVTCTILLVYKMKYGDKRRRARR